MQGLHRIRLLRRYEVQVLSIVTALAGGPSTYPNAVASCSQPQMYEFSSLHTEVQPYLLSPVSAGGSILTKRGSIEYSVYSRNVC